MNKNIIVITQFNKPKSLFFIKPFYDSFSQADLL